MKRTSGKTKCENQETIMPKNQRPTMINERQRQGAKETGTKRPKDKKGLDPTKTKDKDEEGTMREQGRIKIKN